MESIEILILFTVAITIFEVLNIIYSILNFFLLTPLFGMEGIFLPTEWANFIIGFSNQIAAFLIPFYILILLFYIIMYIIYLIIITIIPETGPKSLFIPIREILLQIPPLPSLIKFGVFKLMDKIVYALGMNNFIKSIVSIIGSVLDFSRDNIKRVLILLLPNYADEINNYNYKIEQEEIKEREVKEIKKEDDNIQENDIKKQIEQDKNICISQNTEIITPNMSANEKININFSNIYNKINCEGKAIGNYIRSNK